MADTENVQGRTESDRLTPIQDLGTHAQLGIANCLKTRFLGSGRCTQVEDSFLAPRLTSRESG
jgi:hypothetical protein